MSASGRPRVLFVLQNAWRRSAKPGETEWLHEKVWLRLLWRSMTGKRLREMIPDGIDFEVVNATLRIGDRAAATFPADRLLMLARLRSRRPDLVVLCGKVAQELTMIVGAYGYPCILAPHPAWRALPKTQTAEIREEIELALRDSFPVTDDLLDAPDGAVVDGYERVGDSWERIKQ